MESRQLLAGPQLIGIQPNEGALIVDGTQRSTAPRLLTFGFDQAQQIDPTTTDGIRITRSGPDDVFNTADDVRIASALVTLGDPNENEVVVRFVETLPDDNYRIEVFGYDDDGQGIVGLKNIDGEFFVPSDSNERSDVVDFELKLGALVESVVPQPVFRDPADPQKLIRNDNEIVVYFNEDPLFVEDDASGNPTARSAENPRFYQLLFTNETVGTFDDLRFAPDEVVYDAATHTARLIFSGDINELPRQPGDGPSAGGTWRLRIGTAVDVDMDLLIKPSPLPVLATAVTDFQQGGLRVVFQANPANGVGEGTGALSVRFIDSGSGGVTASIDGNGDVVFDFGGATPTVSDLKTAVANNASVANLITVQADVNGDTAAANNRVVPRSVINAQALPLVAVGDTQNTSFDVGIFGQDNDLSSIVLSEAITAQPYAIELAGGQDDPGHTDEVQHINQAFGADSLAGITEIAYNFNRIFDTDGTSNFLNQITDRQKTRIREALNLWSSKVGVQFRETVSEGITFALGDTDDLQNKGAVRSVNTRALDAAVRVDPTFTDSALVFSNQIVFGTAYGEDFTRKAVAGIGLLLGLNQSNDLVAPAIMSFDPRFLDIGNTSSIDSLTDLEPVFPNTIDVLHGQYVHRPDSVDVDLYRFEVNLNDADKVGLLTAETFAERLPDSSSLDTSITLFEEVTASVKSNLGLGPELQVMIESMMTGVLGNNSRINFIQTDRPSGNLAVRILPAFDASGVQLSNAILVDLPRTPANGTSTLTAGRIVDAINASPLSSAMFRASISIGSASAIVADGELNFPTLVLKDGGLVRIARNDDYFGEDSRLKASLGEGVYYIGVAASGNEQYDPAIPGSGFGGLTQGKYELNLKFEPQVDEVDVIRDLDSDRADVPGTVLDGDGDGVPGGAHNFWFQTRPLKRIVTFNDSGDAVTPGQTIRIVGATGVIRTFEFVPNGQSPSPGNIAVNYSPGGTGFPTPPGNLAAALQAAINNRQNETGVTVQRTVNNLEFTGERSVNFSTGFRGATAIGRNIFVDKAAGPQADGSLERPFNNIANPAVANAFGSAIEGDIVRIIGNGGLDNKLETELDNFSYKIGVSDTGGVTLEDGRNMEVPKGVTTMIDAGAIFKLRNSFIGIGSSTVQVDRSGGALQVLGTPRLVQLSAKGEAVTTTTIASEDVAAPGYDDGSVIFTSIRDRVADLDAAGISPAASPGNWGGLIYRRDLDQEQGRRDLEDEGIFLQRVNHAELRYGGGSGVLIDSVQQLVNPIQIVNMRPTVTFNEITKSADSAISAAPDSFEETSFQSPEFQQRGAFTADYDRVGPEIHGNNIFDNSINGLFIRATTTPTQRPKEFTVAGRFDDIDIVHYVSENLVVAAAPGGSITDGFSPSMELVTARAIPGGVIAAGVYRYKMTFVDDDGFESLASGDNGNETLEVTVVNSNSSVELSSLLQVGTDSDYVSRRLYRTDPVSGEFRLVADLDASSRGFIDRGRLGEAALDLTRQGTRGRLDASLVMDAGLIVKLRGARIELGQGTQLLAEGLDSNPVVFTSAVDDRFGIGGTFDTNNDGVTGDANASRGDWSGIYAGPTAHVSFDNVQLSYAGGISLLEGGFSRGFLALELQQATGRITNSRFEFNDDGQDGAGPAGRFGRLAVTEATIMVRGSQPIIVGNTFADNRGSIIDIDIESMTGDYNRDLGRQTGDIDRLSVLDDNHGPAIRFNRYLNLPFDSTDPGLQLSGLEIRAGTISTETIFDDTDIAHLVFDNIEVGNFHSSGGLRLLSRPDESLVVKFSGPGGPNSAIEGTGITATGSTGAIDDRVGGTVHIIGLPGSPVILTSLQDDTVGAGLKPDGSQFTDHDGDGLLSRPFANDWRGVLLDQFSNDYNIPVLPELELSTEVAPGLNATVDNAQLLGELADNLSTGDHVRRLGFEVQGFLSGNNDVDTYSFIGSPGTEVWIDIDKTSLGLDTVIELLDENGTVLARSNNSAEETARTNATPITIFDPDLQGVTTSLQAGNEQYTDRGVFDLYEDFGSTNTRDAGIHYRLAGNLAGDTRSVYFFRVRSASINPDDVQGGISGGNYRAQLRLVEEQEFPGSVIRYSDIRYANNGIHVQGLMSSSPLLGEAQENESGAQNRFLIDNGTPVGATPGSGGQYIGNLVDGTQNVISVGGALGFPSDVDFYQFEVDFANGTGIQSTIFDIDYADGFNRPDTNISVFFDPDGLPQYLGTGSFEPRLVYFGSSSNIADDLTSPGGENSAIEKLIRGSVSDGDPFIGPVVLPEGVYYVAITSDGVTPSALLAAIREPINSVDRLVEDRVDRINAETRSTANAPSIPRLFADASINASNFSIESDVRLGHGKPDHFDGTTGPVSTGGAPSVNEGTVAGTGFDAPDGISTATPFTSNLDAFDFSLVDDFAIGGRAFGFGGQAELTSTTIPHITVDGNLSNDPADFYQFVIPTTNGQNISKRVIVDIDDAYNIFGEVDHDDDIATPPINTDQSSVDITLILLREDPTNPGTLQLIDTSIDGINTRDGAGGSNALEDPYIDRILLPGNYFIGVLEEGTTFTIDAAGVTTANDAVTNGLQDYRLHVSIEDHVLPPGSTQIGNGADVLAFDRIANDISGSITSEVLDLSGYVAADLPTLYFNRLFQPVAGPGGIGDDTATLTAIVTDASGNTTESLIHTFQTDNDLSIFGVTDDWKQLRISLGQFAGQSNVQLRADYTTNGLIADSNPDSRERGLLMDDFIVGFAERGETVFNAVSNARFLGSGFGTVSGEYQLEMRHGTDFASQGINNQGRLVTQLDVGFDTNERHNRSVTLIAPAGSQVSDGQTFVIGDGASNQTFEFTTVASDIVFGNTAIVFTPTSTAAEVAAAIRQALNNQTAIDIEAATSGGLDTQTPTDGRLSLSGNATGTFLVVSSSRNAPTTPLTVGADGHLEMPAILNDGIGDENFLRTQGQVIVENNVIRDVRGIGIWSEPGLRQVDPSHDVSNIYLDTLHLGNSSPGSVRNLPTLNDSVLGGLAPGIVIQNNTIDQAEYAGIKIDGEIAPLAIIPPDGDSITDGSTFAIDAAGTRVVFEFEDIGQGIIPPNYPRPYGSSTDGGDGVRDGHVPVFIRHTDVNPASPYVGRTTVYTPVEVANAIRESIQGSILMSNALFELVDVEIGPWLGTAPSGADLTFLQPAVYVFGASGIYTNAEIQISQTPISEAPQPFARIVNNTIYGDDGRASNFPQSAQNEPNDVLSQAIDTRLGSSHRGPYIQNGLIGDNASQGASDVDLYKVYLEVGDRLIVDIDTLSNPNATPPVVGPNTIVKVFDDRGIVQSLQDQAGNTTTVSTSGVAPDHLDPLSTAYSPVSDAGNAFDPFVDFTADRTGVFYVGVSSLGNDNYDPMALSGRVQGVGGTGTYSIGLEVFAPRSFVLSGNNGSGRTPLNGAAENDRGGISGGDIVGSTFTVTQIPDVNLQRTNDANGSPANEITFEFVSSNATLSQLGNGNVGIGLTTNPGNTRLPDIMRAIDLAVNGTINGVPTIPNDTMSRGPIGDGKAYAGGGPGASSVEIPQGTFGTSEGIVDNPFYYFRDFNTDGFGHSRVIGSTEQYVMFDRIANIELDAGMIAAGFALDPTPGADTDQLINESGVVIAGGASPTLLNNVFLNLHESVVAEETRRFGFGDAGRGSDQHRKPQEVIVVSSVFQHDEPSPTQFNDDTFFLGIRDFGLTTSRAPSNVNGGTDDFNVTLGNNAPAVKYAEASNFQPALDSLLVDSSVSSLVERDALVNLKTSLGLPISNILAPLIDVHGILRADNPAVAPPGGIGASIFVDRGSNELADFVGPIAIAEAPRDNDADGVDADPAVSTIDLKSGVYKEFRIQLRDTGDASDPFAGIGIDDSTVVIPAIPGVRPSGANVSLFENDRLLTQGIDYTFNYDETKNIITLTPLAGIWRNDRAYRISLNNQDQNVLIASDPADIRDGDQFTITDSDGGTVVFEFETGYQLLLPEPLTMIVPREGTNAGGVRDGDIFQINDGINPPVVFEYNSDTATLPGTVEVTLPPGATPLDPDALKDFLEEIALNTATAIINQVTAGRLDLDVLVTGDPASDDVDVVQDRVILGANLGATLTTSGSGLRQLARTTALRVPAAGSDPVNGVVNGDTFTINNGSTSALFVFNDGTTAPTPGANVIDISGPAPLNTADLATAIVQAIVPSGLGLDPEIIGNQVFLNLPEAGSVTVSSGRLAIVGVARPAMDGDLLTITPNADPRTPVVFEINRIDERDATGQTINDGVAVGNISVDVQRGTTADRFARDLAEAIIQQSANSPSNPNSIAGLNANGIRVVDGGLLVIGGEAGLGLTVTGESLDVVGVPSVADASRIQVFGPLLLEMPTVGGGAIQSGEVLILRDQFGNDVLFEFVSNQGGVQTLDGGFNPDGTVRPLSVIVPYDTFNTNAQIAATLQGVINAQNIGLTAGLGGVGQVSLGRVDLSRVSTAGDPANGIPGINQIRVLRGIVSDQEVLVIRQGNTEVRFEFEEATSGGGVTAGNVPVNFQAGSTVADVANSLAAAINNNAVNLRFTGLAVATPDGEVRLNDVPGTVVDVTRAPTLNVVGVPGGAIPVTISPSFSATEVKLAILEAVNGINVPGQEPFTTLVAQDRGGDTLFVRNGVSFSGLGVTNYFLPAIKDLSGNPLEANRDDLTTQFSILMPNSAVDFGDAPDPVAGVSGRYPTLLVNNGPRHVLDGLLTLGRSIDADLDGRPSPQADGDDRVISISSTGASFSVTSADGIASIVINAAAAANGDGDTITIDTGVDSATLELDLDGIFEEDNFAIRPQAPITTASIAAAINAAIVESPLRPADISAVGVDEVTGSTTIGTTFTATVSGGVLNVTVNAVNSTGQVTAVDGETITIVTDGYQETLELDFNGVTASNRIAITPTTSISNASVSAALVRAISGSQLSQAKISVNGIRLNNSDSLQVITDDEDGVVLTSALNPGGVLNKGAATPIDVTVFGSGVLEAWVDFNADGDWDDPGEKIITRSTSGAIFDDPNRGGITRTFTVTVPATTPVPQSALTTYARFRVSRQGGLEPTGLSLSGEVEDYALLILPGGPPVLTAAQANRTFTVDEGGTLSALDFDGALTSTTNDNGLLEGVVDPDQDQVAIFAEDIGTFTLFSGSVPAGNLTVFENGTFTFSAIGDFNGDITFTARVTDVKPLNPSSQIVQNNAITATISVQPVNDIPVVSGSPGASVTVQEDLANLNGAPFILDAATLITPFYKPGPANESEGVNQQGLVFQTVSSTGNQNGRTDEGGTVEILNNGTEIRYTPPLNFNGTDTFIYIVADVPPAGQLSQASPVAGVVSITVTPVNDDPIAGEDNFELQEGPNGQPQPLVIPANPGTTTSSLLNNDLPGPLQPISGSEGAQTITLADTQVRSFEGGTVDFNRATGVITYTPRAFFSGTDRFSYTITDDGSPAATGTGVVVINVGGTNDRPQFVGIDDPDAGLDGMSLVLTESKDVPLDRSYDLQTWFSDPEGDDLTFTVSSNNPSKLTVTQTSGTLDVRVPPFASGDAIITVTVSDGNGGVLIQPIPVTVIGTPDPPQVITTVDEYNGSEDQNIVVNLQTVFFDPDQEELEYRIVSLDGVQNPSRSQIAAHPLIGSLGPNNANNVPADHLRITGNQLVVTPKPDRFGSADIVLSATDRTDLIGQTDQAGRQSVTYVFTVNFAPVADRPVARGDSYNVPVRSKLEILNPAEGLLRVGTNVADFDADGDKIVVDVSAFPKQTMFGTVDVAENGTFTYTNNLGTVGLVDTFEYRIIDETGLASTPVVVSLTLNQSRYQNPLADLASDVTADGVVSPIDILRVINFLAERGDTLVSEITTAPPDYVDTNGDGTVSPADILQVINSLADQRAAGRGELISPQGELVVTGAETGLEASFAVTTAFAASDVTNLPLSNRLPVERPVSVEEAQLESQLRDEDARDVLLTSGILLSDARLETSELILSENRGDSGADDEAVDQILGGLLDEISLDSLLGGN